MFKKNELFEKLKKIPKENKEEIHLLLNQIFFEKSKNILTIDPESVDKERSEILKRIEDGTIQNMIMVDINYFDSANTEC